MPQVVTQYFAFTGGLDQVTPPIEVPNGAALRHERRDRTAWRLHAHRRVRAIQRPDAAVVGAIHGSARHDHRHDPARRHPHKRRRHRIRNGDRARGRSRHRDAHHRHVSDGHVTHRRAGGGDADERADGERREHGEAGCRLHEPGRRRLSRADLPGAWLLAASWACTSSGGKVYAFRNNGCRHRGRHAREFVFRLDARRAGARESGLRSARASSPSRSPRRASSPGSGKYGLAAGQAVTFSTTGALPTGMTAGVTYYVLSPTVNTFPVGGHAGRFGDRHERHAVGHAYWLPDSVRDHRRRHRDGNYFI